MDHPDVLYRIVSDRHRALEQSARTSRLASRRERAHTGAIARLRDRALRPARRHGEPSHRLG
jgi:hypothetical protein